MKQLLYWIIMEISKVHEYILKLNDGCEYKFSDKELHFIVIAILGMMLLAVIYPLFKALSKKHVMVIAWIYVFTVMIVITFAIEIGQKVTNTGNMEFADIVFGIIGFLVAFFVFSIFRGIYHLIIKCIKNAKVKKEQSMKELNEEKTNI